MSTEVLERRYDVLRMVATHPMYPTPAIAKLMNRDREGVYRDLLALEQAGRVKRIKTGAWTGHRWFVEGY